MNIPGVCQKKGQTYRRFRVKNAAGKWVDQYVKLPDPSHPKFAEELQRVNGAAKERTVILRGSVRALAIEFRQALANGWTKKTRKKGAKALSPNTRTNYLRYVAMIEASHGSELVASLTPANVYALRNKMANMPGKANNWLNVLKLMLTFAEQGGWIRTNPARDVGLLPIGEHEPWPREVLEQALATASPMLRLAIVSGLCSGQRVSDVITIRHDWLKTGIMELSQIKTNVDAAVAVHPWWREEIDRLEKKSTTILYDRSGKPFGDEDRIQERIRVLMRQLGYVVRDDDGTPLDKLGEPVAEGGKNKPQVLYTFHGLRKNACCYLLELGLTDSDVGLILGMSADTVRHYGKRARAYMVAVRSAETIAAGNIVRMGR